MTFIVGLLALCCGLGPVRQGLRLSRLNPSQLGIAIIVWLVAVAAIAGLSEPLLSAGDVSVPTARIAAGLVLALTGLLRVLRPVFVPEDRPIDFSDAWHEAGMPAAFPVMLQPVIAMLAVSAGADLGWLGATVAAVPAAVVMAGFARMLATDRAGQDSESARPGVPAAIRAFGMGAAALGVTLMVDGVIDV